MANWSYTEITLSGSEQDILFAETELKNNITDGWLNVSKYMKDDSVNQRAGYSSAEVISIDILNDTIELSLSGRWCSPHQYFEDFAERHNLSGEYADSEEGCNFFHLMKFKDGIKIHDEESNYFSQESIDYHDIDMFIEEYHWIAKDDDWENEWSEIIKLFTANGYTIEQLKELWT